MWSGDATGQVSYCNKFYVIQLSNLGVASHSIIWDSNHQKPMQFDAIDQIEFRSYVVVCNSKEKKNAIK